MQIKTYFIKHLNNIFTNRKKKSVGGKNFLGRICISHRGNINKRVYRFIDFFRRINS